MGDLKRTLLAEYGTFADKRIKNIDVGKRFIADDRSPGDIGADKKLYSYFCMIFADVVSPDHVRVMLSGNVPDSEEVRAVSASLKAKRTDRLLELDITKGKQASLRMLAGAIRAITRRGATKYTVPSYKFVCPRTADSLERLARALDMAWTGDRA